MSETIYFNGKKYNDISETPSSVRQLVEKLIYFRMDQNKTENFSPHDDENLNKRIPIKGN